MSMDWENAFFEQYQDACVGRMLRGILHNLNGANQAFSLQATLFKTMFTQAEKLLQEAAGAYPDCECALEPVRELLRKRSVMAEQMEEKVAVSQRIVSRVLPLAQLYTLGEECTVSLASIVDLEMEILTADSFFKHRVDKGVELAPDLPPLRRHFVELHSILFTLMDNSLAALRDSENPVLRLAARRVDEELVIEVRDSGQGVAPEVAGRIFEPFFSTREGALGVGLFLARKMATALGGEIAYRRTPGETCFTVTLPLTVVA